MTKNVPLDNRERGIPSQPQVAPLPQGATEHLSGFVIPVETGIQVNTRAWFPACVTAMSGTPPSAVAGLPYGDSYSGL